MIEKLLSPLSLEIWYMLDYPEEWMYESRNSNGKPFYIIHKDTHICLWVCNGIWFLNGYKTMVWSWNETNFAVTERFETKVPDIGVFDRHILWHKVKKVMEYLDNENNPQKLVDELREYNEIRRI